MCFFAYLGGGWLKSREIPADKSRIDRSFEVITDRNAQILLNIASRPSSGKVHEFYKSCMDLSFIESQGITPVYIMWAQLFEPTDKDFFPTNMAMMFQHGFSAFFTLGTEIDASQPSQVIYSLRQGGLSLPDPSLYKDNTMFLKFFMHVQNMFRLSGETPEDAQNLAFEVTSLEFQISQITIPPDQLFDPFKSFNKMPWTQLIKLAPNLHFQDLVDQMGLKLDVSLTLDAPTYFSRLSALLSQPETTPERIHAYMRWRILNTMAPRLSSKLVKENFAFFGTVLTGVTVPQPRNTSCIQAADRAMPELVGRLFVEAAFPESSKNAAAIIFDNIIAAFKINSQKLEWMDPITNRRAMEKIDKLLKLIGYPENPRNYTQLKFTQSYSHNVNVAVKDAYSRLIQAAGGPSDRRQWEMSADTVNAYFDPTRNVMAFPAGILQTPFFNPDFPSCMNYGGIGMIGGHELTHGFDSQGRLYSGDGKLVDWWEPKTSEEFQKRVDCIIAQYSKFSPLPGYFVNGNLTQGENIADAGGLKTAHSAYVNAFPSEAKRPSIVPNLNNEQLFFVGFAQTWCSKLTPAAIRQRLLTDPHSPPRFRVNGPAINSPAFAKAFNCPVGSPMNPPQSCQVW